MPDDGRREVSLVGSGKNRASSSFHPTSCRDTFVHGMPRLRGSSSSTSRSCQEEYDAEKNQSAGLNFWRDYTTSSPRNRWSVNTGQALQQRNVSAPRLAGYTTRHNLLSALTPCLINICLTWKTFTREAVSS